MMNEKILEAFSKALGAVKAAPLKAVTGVAAHKVAAVAVASTLALGGAGVGVGVHMANEKNDPVTEEATVSPKKDASKKVATKSDTPASTEAKAPVETAPTSAANDTAAPTSTSTNDSNKTKTTNKTASEKTASSKKATATEQTSNGKHPDQGKVDSIGDIWRNGVHYFCHGGSDTIYKLPDGFQGTDAQCQSHMTQKEAEWKAEENAVYSQQDQKWRDFVKSMEDKYPDYKTYHGREYITDPADYAAYISELDASNASYTSPNRFDYVDSRQDVGAVYWAFAPDQINLTGQTKIFYYGQ